MPKALGATVKKFPADDMEINILVFNKLHHLQMPSAPGTLSLWLRGFV